MIVPARRRVPRTQNYRRAGVWPGLGDLVAKPNYETCDPRDVACVARNTAAADQWSQAIAKAQADANLAQCRANADNASSPQQKADVLASCGIAYSGAQAYSIEQGTPAANANWGAPVGIPLPQAATRTAARGGQLTFSTSRGGTSLQVGDTWQVSITGASPNSPVTVKMGSDITPMGSTDGAGSFSKSGTFDSSTVGSWQETWAVGGVTSGSVSFTVAAATTPDGKTIIKSGGTQTGSTSATSISIGGFDLSTIPWWGWLAAGGAVLYAMKGGR